MDPVRAVPLAAPLRWIARLLRALPTRLPGKIRIASALLRNRPGTVSDRFEHAIAVPSLREPIAQQLFANGSYEPEVAALIDRLHAGQTFVDVGANVGVFTLLGARRVGPTGRVLAVEASPLVASYLRLNVNSNRYPRVIIEAAALADEEGTAALYEPLVDRFGMASLIPRFHASPTRVPQTTLTQLAAQHRLDVIDLLKVDVEGAELLVFKGAAQLLQARRIKLIVFEFLDWAEQGRPGVQPGSAQEYLHSKGYDLFELADFLENKPPARTMVRTGGAMLVARPI